MPKDAHRRAVLEPRLQKHGYIYEFFWGLDATQARAALPDFQVETCRQGLTPNEVACAIGHLSMYRNGVDERIKLILEDDAIPLEVANLPSINTVASQLCDGDVLILGVSAKREYLAGSPAPHLHPLALRLDTFSIYMLRGTVAYALNTATAEAITQLQKKQLMQADAWWHFVRNGAIRNIYLLECFGHPVASVGNSNIEASRVRVRGTLHRLTICCLKIGGAAVVGLWRGCTRARRM